MPATNVKQLVAETRKLIDEVEAGETAHAAWIAIQDRVERLMNGRTQAEVAALLGKGRDWVKEMLAWSGGPDHPPFAQRDPDRRKRRKSEAKKVLRDPEVRAEVLESLSEAERLEVAKAAMAPEARENLRSHKENVSHRESRPARERGVIELISAKLDMADLNILDATHTANETAWDDPEVNAMAEGRIDRTAMRLDLLRMAISGDGDIGAELARVEEES